jgi:hypothetical protein
MSFSSTSHIISIVDYKKPFNVNMNSVKEYFASVLVSDRVLSRGAFKNRNIVFKDHFVHNITIIRDYIERIISAKYPAQMKKPSHIK